jgi:hypothetical protein
MVGGTVPDVAIEGVHRMPTTLAEQFARAVATKDHAGLRSALCDRLDFRAMTPNRMWEAEDADGVVEAINCWFGDEDVIESVEAVAVDEFADRQRVGYRFRVRRADGDHLVEQQAYLSSHDGQIAWLRIMCSGYRPVG